jgi:putative salt-induced outer membrane protein YdiY
MEPSKHLFALAGIVVAILIGPAAAPAEAQIVNTLRRWSDAEPGWDGDVEARFAVASGNTEYLEFAGGASVQFVTERDHRVRGFSNVSVRRANGEKVAESFVAHLRHNYRLTPVFSTLVFLQHSSDPFRRIERRTLAGGGTRIDLVREESWEGSIGLSAMYEGEKLTDDPGGEVEREFRGSFFASAIGNVTETLRVDLSAFYQPLFSDWGDDRVFLASSLRVDVVGELDLIVHFDLTHESRPPADVEPTDIRFSTGLVFDF